MQTIYRIFAALVISSYCGHIAADPCTLDQLIKFSQDSLAAFAGNYSVCVQELGLDIVSLNSSDSTNPFIDDLEKTKVFCSSEACKLGIENLAEVEFPDCEVQEGENLKQTQGQAVEDAAKQYREVCAKAGFESSKDDDDKPDDDKSDSEDEKKNEDKVGEDQGTIIDIIGESGTIRAATPHMLIVGITGVAMLLTLV